VITRGAHLAAELGELSALRLPWIAPMKAGGYRPLLDKLGLQTYVRSRGEPDLDAGAAVADC
jgi:hypothetical protein